MMLMVNKLKTQAEDGERMENMEKGCVNQISNKGIIHQIIGFALKHRKVMQHYLDETGVYQAQHHLLMRISHDRYATQKDLVRLMNISAATIAVSLKKLEKGGYIKKEMVQEDNRLNQIIITEKGNKVVEQSKQIFDATDRKVLDGFTEEEKVTLSSLLYRLNTNLSRMEDEIKTKK